MNVFQVIVVIIETMTCVVTVSVVLACLAGSLYHRYADHIETVLGKRCNCEDAESVRADAYRDGWNDAADFIKKEKAAQEPAIGEKPKGDDNG